MRKLINIVRISFLFMLLSSIFVAFQHTDGTRSAIFMTTLCAAALLAACSMIDPDDKLANREDISYGLPL